MDFAELRPHLSALADAFSKIWELDKKTLETGGFATFEVFLEGLWTSDSDLPETFPTHTNVYALHQGEHNFQTEHGLSINESQMLLIREVDALEVSKGREKPSCVFERLGAGTLLEMLIILLDSAVRSTTEDEFVLADLLASDTATEEAFEEFESSKFTKDKLKTTANALPLDQISDEKLRKTLNYVLAPLYVRTQFSPTGLKRGADLLTDVGIYSDTEILQNWLGWESILGEICGETDTGGRTYLVKIKS